MILEQLQFLEQQISQLDQEMASLLSQYQDAVQRLAEVPGLGVDSAQQIIAEVGPTAATFPSEKCLSSWVGACPGNERAPASTTATGLRRATATCDAFLTRRPTPAVKTEGSIFEVLYRRCVPRLGHNQAIGAIAHRQCRLIWLILHQGVRYEERGPGRHQANEAKAHNKDDPRAPKARLPNRNTDSRKPQARISTMIFDPVPNLYRTPRAHSTCVVSHVLLPFLFLLCRPSVGERSSQGKEAPSQGQQWFRIQCSGR